MSVDELSTAVSSAVLTALASFVNFIPSLVGGLIILTIGMIIAAVVYRVIIAFLRTIQLEKFLARYGITHIEGKDIEWAEILAEIARWAIILVFLVPTFSAWRLDAVNTVLNRLVLYIPNVSVFLCG